MYINCSFFKHQNIIMSYKTFEVLMVIACFAVIALGILTMTTL